MRISRFGPLLVFAGLALALAVGLTLNPKDIPSALIGDPVPVLDLPPLYEGGAGLKTADLASGGITLVNVFASWCGPCIIEHPQITALAEEHGLKVIGLNYKNNAREAKRFLDRLGNPYAEIGVDADGRAGFELGVYGVPETFIIDGTGTIRYKLVQPIMPGDIEKKILPVIARIEAGE